MPHYDYICAHCAHEEEIFQKITDKPLAQCPQCQHSTFKRKLSGGIGLQFRGSGFYITDYANPSCPPSEKATSSGECGCGKTSCPS